MVYEYRELGVKRAYFSAFSAVDGTAFEEKASQPRWREHRLYQTDWLYREYEFGSDEIGLAFNDEGLLANSDPKVRIALTALDSPVDPNVADYRALIRVPGIGRRSAYRLVNLRKVEKIWKREQLVKLGVRAGRAMPFLKLNGWAGATLDRWSQ